MTMSRPDAGLRDRFGGAAGNWSFYAFAFLTAKATAFLGPLAIAYLSGAEVYGTIELAFGYGLLLGPLLTLGVAIAAPQHMLMEDDPEVLDRMGLSVLGAAVAGMLLAGLAMGGVQFWLDNRLTAVLVALMIAPSAAQIALSTYSRTRGWKSAAAWLDNTATHLLWMTGLALFAIGGSVVLSGYVGVYLVSNLVIAGLAIWFAVTQWKRPVGARYRHSLRIGFPMMLNGVTIFLVMGSSRILIGSFLDAEALAGYAYLFRIAGMILLIHQFFMTAWAVKIYKEDSGDVDRQLAIFCGLISLAGLAVFVGLNLPVAQRVFPEFVDPDNVMLIGLTVCQVVLWSLSASLEPRINRLLKAGRMAFITGGVAAGLLGSVVALSWFGTVTVSGIIAITCLAQTCLIGLQLFIGREPGSRGLALTARTMFIGPVAVIGLTLMMEGVT